MSSVKNLYFKRTGQVAWYAALLFFSYLMLLITLQYIPARRDAAFLLTKFDVVGMLHYRIAFFAHVYSAMFVLLAGILQFAPGLRRRYPELHRWCGRVYAYLIIFITGPAGFIMGIYGNGGLISQSAFCLLAVLWVIFTWKAVATAIAGKMQAHKDWMYRSYALTLSAITLRFWKWLFVWLFQPRPMDVYHVVSWLGWVGNLLIAEALIYYSFKNKRNKRVERMLEAA